MNYLLYRFCLFMFIIILFVSFLLAVLFYRTKYYVNYLNDCNVKAKFCYIKKIKLQMPPELIYPLAGLAEKEGVRVEMAQKAQRNISMEIIQNNNPEVISWYKSLPPILSKIIGEPVFIAPLSQANSLSLVVYEKEGDFIDWHFDTNHYNGRFFTLLVPVSTEETCGKYQYKNENEEVTSIDLNIGDAILFEGDKVFHRAKELCKDQKRVILSMTFVTSKEMDPFEVILSKFKNFGIFGKF